MDLALTLLALISGGTLVAGYFLIKELKQALFEVRANNSLVMGEVLKLRDGHTPSEDRLKLLEQKVAAIQMKSR